MSITSNFPAIKPSLLLDFASTKQLDSRITFTRASTATYYGTQTAKAEENLLLQSQDFATTWTTVGGNATVTANTSTAPDGTTTADTLTEDSATGGHLCFQSGSAAGVVTLSVFAKLGSGTRFLTIGVNRDATHTASATFNLSLGTNTQTQVNGGIYSSPSATITAVAQSFYRCTFTLTTDTANSFRIGFSDTGTPSSSNRGFGASYTGDGTSSLIIWGAQLEQRSAASSYTATTTQSITNYIPQLLTAASGVARFDNNPTTFESLGLLIEESRTNLVTYSEQFDNAAWTKTRASITANTIVAPDGTLTGDKLVEDTTASNSHLVAQSIVFPASGTVTATIYAKAAERNFILFSRTTVNTCGVNLTTGQVVGVSGTDTTATTQSVGNGWWRIILVFPSPNTTATVNIYTSLDGVFANRDYTGDGYSGIYIWGAQLEAGAFATSYIPTVASQVTRASDAASMTGTNFSSWYNAGQGTLYAEANTPSFATNYVFADINNNSISTYIRQSTASTGTTTQLAISDNGVLVASPGVSVTLGSYRKMAGAYTADSVQQSVNGFLGTEDTSSIIPSGLVQMNIGTRSSGASPVNGTIKKIAYYPLRVTNAQLQGLTS